MRRNLPLKQIFWIALTVIIITIPLLIYSTNVKVEKFNIQSISNQIMTGSRLGGYHYVTGLGFVIETTEGRNFIVYFDMKNEAKQLLKKFNTDKSLWTNVNITYTNYLFGFSKDVTGISLSDGELFTFIY